MHGPLDCCMHAPPNPMIIGSKENTGLETAQGLPAIREDLSVSMWMRTSCA